MKFRLPVIVFCALLAGIAARDSSGQAPAPAPSTPLAADSPLLYNLFFRFHSDFDNWLAARKAAAPVSAADLDAGAAGILSVRAGDVSVLSLITRGAAADLERIDREERAYVNRLAPREQKPDIVMLRQYQAQRDAAVAAGMAALRERLSGESYSALLGFINGRFRTAHRTGQP